MDAEEPGRPGSGDWHRGGITAAITAAIAAALAVLVAVAGEPVVTVVLIPLLAGVLSTRIDRFLSGTLLRFGPRLRPRRGRQPGWARAAADVWAKDAPLLVPALCLVSLSGAIVPSVLAARDGPGGEEGAYLARVLLAASGGMFVMSWISRVDLARVRRSTPLIVAVGVPTAALVDAAVLPLLALLFVSHTLAGRPIRGAGSGVAVPVAAVIAVCHFVASEPAGGAAVVTYATLLGVLVVHGASPRRVLGVGAACTVALVALVLLKPHRTERVLTFLDPWSDPVSSGFQAVQGQIAVGSGGLFGLGLGESMQKFLYLPEAGDDWVLAVIAEELGVVGLTAILGCFGWIGFVGLRAAKAAPTAYARLLAAGGTTVIVGQALLHAYHVLGLAPSTATGLPLVSFGELEVVVVMAVLGLLHGAGGTDSQRDRRPRPSPATLLAWRRLGLLFATLLGLLAVAEVRVWFLGVMQAEELSHVAVRQHVVEERVPALRGPIGDRHGTPLAYSRPAVDVRARLAPGTSRVSIARRVAPAVGVREEVLMRRLTGNPGDVVTLVQQALPEVGAAVRHLGLAAVEVESTHRRIHPRRTLAAQVLGPVGVDRRGLGGVEYGFDRLLAGRDGERRVVRDALGRPLFTLLARPAVNGQRLRLTVDIALQRYAEATLAKIGERGSAALVLDTETGHVRALANFPAYDPNVVDGRPRAPMRNRAIDIAFEVGPIARLIAAAAVLDEGLAEAVDLHRASSKALLERVGAERFDLWLRRFGLGHRSALRLPGEQAGTVPPLDRYEAGSLRRLAVGEAVTASLVQLASVYAVVAGDGALHPASLVGRLDGRTGRPPAPRPVISVGTARVLASSLRPVQAFPTRIASWPRGTHKRARRAIVGVGFTAGARARTVTAVVVEPRAAGAHARAPVERAVTRIQRFATAYLGAPRR